jgi:hypothetical protein
MKNIFYFYHSSKGIPYPKNPRAFPILRSDIHADTAKARQLVLTILQKKLGALKHNKEIMDIDVVFEQDGTLRDLSYIRVNKNTLITPNEIEQIEQKLKAEIRVRYTGKDNLDHVAISYEFPRIVF